MNTSIDIVLPFYNPSSDWPAHVTNAMEQLIPLQPDARFTLILVDDGTLEQEMVRSGMDKIQSSNWEMRPIRLQENQGKGAALRAGVSMSSADVTLYTDIDFPYDAKSMNQMIECVKGGADVALGYREQDYYQSVPWFRRGLSVSFRFLLKQVLQFPIVDTQCGLKGMNAKGRVVFNRTKIDRFLVDMEFIKRAARQKDVTIEPVVVHLRPSVVFSKMGLGVLFREGLNFLRILFL